MVHKGDYGKLLVIGGSKTYTGSPLFVCLAGYRAGADLVVFLGHERAANVIANYTPEMMTVPSEKFWHLKWVKWATAYAIGNGLSEWKKGYQTIKKLQGKRMVIDADGIRALSKFGWEGLDLSNAILTPHVNEFLDLTGGEKPTSQSVKKWAKIMKTTIILKGKIDIISNGKELYLNKTGNDCMTVGGTGDVLAGVIAGLLSHRKYQYNPFNAARIGTRITGLAGDVAAKKFGRSLMPTDVINTLPEVFMKEVKGWWPRKK